MLSQDQAILIAKKSGKQHEVSYEMVVNERTPEEALYECGIPITEWKLNEKEGDS